MFTSVAQQPWSFCSEHQIYYVGRCLQCATQEAWGTPVDSGFQTVQLLREISEKLDGLREVIDKQGSPE